MAERVLVVGASGFGREALDVLEAMISAGGDIEVVGVLDDAPTAANLERLEARGVRHLGATDAWLSQGDTSTRYVLGIGSPAVRRKLVAKLDAAGLSPFTAVHPSATFGALSTPGEGAVVCAGVAVSNNVRFGRHVHLNPNATIGHDAVLGSFVSINPAATISGDVDVEPGVLVGAGATVLQGLRVGEGTVVGAGAVVTRSVPPQVVAKGVPARWPESVSEVGEG